MFEDFGAKQHFDAANTTCCNQPVTPFYNKPQYAEQGAPMQATRCTKDEEVSTCNQFELTALSGTSVCAGSVHDIYDIRAFCPKICDDLRELGEGTSFTTAHGTVTLSVIERADEWQLSFTPNAPTAQDHYDRCLGTRTYVEDICDGFELEWTLNAGLDSPNGCYCDCCGTNGKYSPPSGAISWATPSPTWNAAVSPGAITVIACRGGTLSGGANTYFGGYQSLSWLTGPSYGSSGSDRYVTGTPNPVGDANHPACCGASITVTGTTGCGGYQTATRVVSRMPGSTYWDPSASTLYAGDVTTIRAVGSCNTSAYRELIVEGDAGISTSGWGAVSYATVGEMRRGLGPLAFTNSFEYKGCCGYGQIGAAYNDGCGYTGTKYWDVRNPSSSPSTTIGRVFRAQQVGLNYRVYATPLRCDGQEGGSWTEFSATNYASVADCNSAFDSASDSVITGACASSTYCPSAATCCAYVNNGQSGAAFRAAIFCVNNSGWSTTPICCTVPYWGGAAWVYNTSGTCCPN
jgi:hypothetical protein